VTGDHGEKLNDSGAVERPEEAPLKIVVQDAPSTEVWRSK
jgi:hypothetical protein